jgi:hypothetical protein
VIWPRIAVVLAVAMCIAIIPTCATDKSYKETVSMQGFVPTEINGWKTQDQVETYDRETIFDYIDGAGEVYLMYDFRKVAVYHFTKTEQPDILLELFDMGSSQDAFGIFSHAREGEDQGIGQGSEYRGGVLCFWKNNYFVCVLPERETPEAKEAVEDLARHVAGKIEVVGAKPELLGCLPNEGLDSNTVRYFHKHTTLNYHYYTASENILKLGPRTEAVLATYRPSGAYLLCIRYPDREQAKEALASFLAAYLPEAKEFGSAEIEDGKWVTAEQDQVFVIVVFDSPDQTYARTLMKAVEDRISRWPSEGGRNP